MRRFFVGVAVLACALFSASCNAEPSVFKFSVERLFVGGRFPGLAVTSKGTILAFWGDKHFSVRRSIDNGKTFAPEQVIANPGINGGGVIVNKDTGMIFAFSQARHPPSQKYVHKSSDDGLTWETEKLSLTSNDTNANTELHFAGSGVHLRLGKCKGLMIRPTRVYGNETGFNTSIVSRDGVNWTASGFIPVYGTGEGAITEVDENRILYSSRRHWFASENELTSNRLLSISKDCGLSWKQTFEANGLPDGPVYRSLKLGKGASHQGHFGIMGDMTKIQCDGKRILLHTGIKDPLSNWNRRGLTIWASTDDGKSWPKNKLIHDNPSAYSSIAVIENKDNCKDTLILVHFEGGMTREYQGSYLAIFNWAWLSEN